MPIILFFQKGLNLTNDQLDMHEMIYSNLWRKFKYYKNYLNRQEVEFSKTNTYLLFRTRYLLSNGEKKSTRDITVLQRLFK